MSIQTAQTSLQLRTTSVERTNPVARMLPKTEAWHPMSVPSKRTKP
jgi:hypothetical protein